MVVLVSAVYWNPAGLAFLGRPEAFLTVIDRPLDISYTYGAVAALGSVATMAVMLRLMRAPLWYAPLFPLGALVTAFILLRAAVRGTRKIEWKGRSYPRPTGGSV